MKVYLAGKMDAAHGAWRDCLLKRQGNDWKERRKPPYWEIVRDSNEATVDWGDIGVMPWPTTPNTLVLGMHDYVGPYRTTYKPTIDTKYTGYFHGTTVTGQHGFTNFQDHAAIVRECTSAIRRSDLVFAYINSPDCFGTIAEIGMARAMGIYVALAIESAGGWEDDDYWFLEQIADANITTYEHDNDPSPVVTEYAPNDWSDAALSARITLQKWEDRRARRVEGFLKDAIVRWTARKVNAVAASGGADYDVTVRVVRESAQSFSQISRWSADPRVRAEADRMLSRIAAAGREIKRLSS